MSCWSTRVVRPLLVLILAAGCGGGGGHVDDADAAIDAPVIDLVTLVERSWSLAPGVETYRCTRRTVSEDMYIAGFRALAPPGTHHTVLSVHESASAPDGDYNCGSASLAHTMLYASGVGTGAFDLPEGVAIRLRAGQQLDLNLHLYNASDATLTGISGTQVTLVPAAAVMDEAEVVFGGQFLIDLQADAENGQTVHGGCRFAAAGTVIALWPHMHRLGRHVRVVHAAAAGDVTLLDAPFDFDEQEHHAITPVRVEAGERLAIDCVYLNDTGGRVTFGESSDSEMCMVGVYRYPATGAGLFACMEFGP